MYGVVNEPGGTGGHLKLAGIELSGKSGTAQVIGYDKMALVRKGTQFADNARSSATPPSAIRKFALLFWFRKAASMAVKQPVQSSGTSSKPITIRRQRRHKAN